MNKKFFNIIFYGTLLFLIVLFSFQIHKFINYKESIIYLKDYLYSENNSGDVSSGTLEELNSDISSEDINHDTGAGLEQESPPNYYVLDIANFDVLENYIDNHNNEFIEIYSRIYNTIRNDLTKDTIAIFDESSISLKSNVLYLSLIDIDSKNIIKNFEINISSDNKNYIDSQFTVSVSNLNVLSSYLKDSQEGTLTALDEIQKAIQPSLKKDLICYIDTNSIVSTDKVITFNVLDKSTNKLVKSISFKI